MRPLNEITKDAAHIGLGMERYMKSCRGETMGKKSTCGERSKSIEIREIVIGS